MMESPCSFLCTGAGCSSSGAAVASAVELAASLPLQKQLLHHTNERTRWKPQGIFKNLQLRRRVSYYLALTESSTQHTLNV